MPILVLDSKEVRRGSFTMDSYRSLIGLGGLVLLLLLNQLEVGMSCYLCCQLLVLRTEALASLGEAGLGAGDGLVDEVDGEADGGGGDDRHGDFLSGSYGLAVGRNPD